MISNGTPRTKDAWKCVFLLQKIISTIWLLWCWPTIFVMTLSLIIRFGCVLYDKFIHCYCTNYTILIFNIRHQLLILVHLLATHNMLKMQIRHYRELDYGGGPTHWIIIITCIIGYHTLHCKVTLFRIIDC